MIECACGQAFDADDDEEYFSECECGAIICDECCAPPLTVNHARAEIARRWK